LSNRTEDDRQWVIGTLSDTRPLIEYLFDREAKSLEHRLTPDEIAHITEITGLSTAE
jgi:hypothetical protein